MNKYKKLSSTVFSACILLLTACNKQLDINTDPNRLVPSQVTINNLLPAGEQSLASVFYNAGAYGNFYTQYLGGNASAAAYIDSYSPYGFNELWGPAYLSAMPNYKDIITRANATGAPQYAGVASLMMGITLMQCTDIWGDIPYKEAFLGAANLNPHYDPQQEIYYTDIKGLLDQAIADLSKPVPTLASLQLGKTDLIYGGNITKWLKAAYATRARYYLNLSSQSASNYQKAIADANLAFDDQTGAGDLQLNYTSQITNPWYNSISLVAAAGRYARPSVFLVNLMNGNTGGVYPNLFDPRLPKLVDNGGAATYVGRPVGAQDNTQGANLTNTDITANTYYGQNTSPIPVITYAEVQFIKAEALFNTGDKANAYTAYLNGITGTMVKWGVSPTNMNTYISNPLISKGAGNLTLSDIMLQKYISMFLQMETWTDMRRYQYDPTVYIGLTKPFIDILGNVWVQRGNYAGPESGTNPNVPTAPTQLTKLWLFN